MSPWQRKLRRALGSVKDQTTISFAKVASARAPDLEVAVVKATTHDEALFEEKHVLEILHLISFSRFHANTCVTALVKRLSKTHSWIVAIKVLMLIHRLLLDGNPAFQEELLLASRRGTRVLNLSSFRDDSHVNGWDFSAFVRIYALYLDELLDFNMGEKPQSEGRSSNARSSGYESHGSFCEDYGSAGRHSEERATDTSDQVPKSSGAIQNMKPHELLVKIPSIQRLLERVLACLPTGAARMNLLVHDALCLIVKESFQLYVDLRNGLALILDAFFDMEQADCMKAFDIYTRGSKQLEELDSFYTFCKSKGICMTSRYPLIQKVSEDLLETMEDFLRDCMGHPSLSKCQEHTSRPTDKGLECTSSPLETEFGIEDKDLLHLNSPMSLLGQPVLPQDRANIFMEDACLKNEQTLLDLEKPRVATDELSNQLALILLSDEVPSTSKQWEPLLLEAKMSAAGSRMAEDKSSAGWELALLSSSTRELSRPSSIVLAGGLDRLLVDDMYEQAFEWKRLSVSVPSDSASSSILVSCPPSSLLALPAPTAQVGEDPFAASLSIPPPPYVQMEDMKQKQQLLVQEQELWSRYHKDGMQGHHGLMKLYNTGYHNPLQIILPSSDNVFSNYQAA